MPVPAERASWPPRPILSSTLCTVVPSGISNSGIAFPTRMSEPGPDTTVSPTEALRSQDVALLAVRVVQQRDARRAVRVVLDRRHLGGNAELLAPEVDPPIPALVPAALPAVGDVALVVAAAGASQWLEQRLFGLRLRHVGEVGDRAEPRARRHRSKLSDAHISPRTRRSRRLL